MAGSFRQNGLSPVRPLSTVLCTVQYLHVSHPRYLRHWQGVVASSRRRVVASLPQSADRPTTSVSEIVCIGTAPDDRAAEKKRDRVHGRLPSRDVRHRQRWCRRCTHAALRLGAVVIEDGCRRGSRGMCPLRTRPRSGTGAVAGTDDCGVANCDVGTAQIRDDAQPCFIARSLEDAVVYLWVCTILRS